jgi:nucleoside-diphosphate-sugar epimerase
LYVLNEFQENKEAMTQPIISLFALLLATLLLLGSARGMSTAAPTTTNNKTVQKKVAVIGTTGRLGRQAIMKLSAQGIPTKCLLRHDVSSLQKKDETPPLQLQDGMDSRAIAWYLSTLPHVEMVQGDVTDQDSVKVLLQDCTAVLALYGAGRVSKFTDLFPWSNPKNDPTHPRQVNYEGVRNIIQAAKECKTCKRIVRITGTQNVSPNN